MMKAWIIAQCRLSIRVFLLEHRFPSIALPGVAQYITTSTSLQDERKIRPTSSTSDLAQTSKCFSSLQVNTSHNKHIPATINQHVNLRLTRRPPTIWQTAAPRTRQFPSRPRRRMPAHHEAIPALSALAQRRQRRRVSDAE